MLLLNENNKLQYYCLILFMIKQMSKILILKTLQT